MSDSDRFQHLRLLEALLFAFSQPVSLDELGRFFADDVDLKALLEELEALYANRGIHLVRVEDRWALRTAPDLAPMMKLQRPVRRKLSRAAIETLAIIAYHQPVTRAEIEEIRGVGMSKGTLDTLLEAGWIKPKGRRRTPGRPVTWGTTLMFLDHFGLENLDALPGQEELKAAGMLDKRPAITALGRIPGTAEADPDASDEDGEIDPLDEDDEAANEMLESDFGEELVAPDDIEGPGDVVADEAESHDGAVAIDETQGHDGTAEDDPVEPEDGVAAAGDGESQDAADGDGEPEMVESDGTEVQAIDAHEIDPEEADPEEVDPEEPERLSAVGPDAMQPGGDLVRPMNASATNDGDM